MINKVILVGRVGRDPEIRHFENNQQVANFTLATSYTYKNRGGEKVTDTDWHNLVLWGAQADIANKYVKKGMLLYIEGRIRNRSYDDKDGNKRYVTEVLVENFQMLSPKENGAGAPATSSVPGTMQTSADYVPDNTFVAGTAPTDDLPF